MKIILIYVGNCMKCPPAITLTKILCDLHYDVTVITSNIGTLSNIELYKNKKIYDLELDMYNKNIVKRGLQRYRTQKNIWKIIDRVLDEESIIWVISDDSIKYLGKRLLKYNYILHFLELTDEIIYYSCIPYFKLNARKYCENSKCVVQAEYNRSHICKAMWNLTSLPYVLPNKPYSLEEGFESNVPTEVANRINSVLMEVGNRKIILYQGILSPERPLDAFADTIENLGNNYVFIIMSSTPDPYRSRHYKNYIYIPFIDPPYHLMMTRYAHIGVLSYAPIANAYSPLNAVYCAPNKIYEYSRFGIPMIGNDVPGLSYLYKTQGCGEIVKKLAPYDIKNAIELIENDYEFYSKKSKMFYEQTDMKTIVGSILKKANS